MKRWWILPPVIGLLLFSGCIVRSVRPYYEEKNRTQVPDLWGSWMFVRQGDADVSDKGIPDWNFYETELVCFDEDRRPGVIETVWFKVGPSLFIDFYPGAPEDNSANFFWSSLLLPMHVVCRVDQKSDSLLLVPVDLDWFTKKIKENSKKWGIAAVDWEDQGFFDAFPAHWTAWLEKYGRDPEAFRVGNALIFRRAR